MNKLNLLGKVILYAVFYILFMSSTPVNKHIELYIWAGQSNAQGWKGNAAKYPEDKDNLDKDILFYYVFPDKEEVHTEGKWTALKPQKGRFPDGHFGPEITFARNLKRDGRNIAVFKYSKGATSLKGQWRHPGKNGLYDKMVAEYTKAVNMLTSKGYTVTVKGFIWIQGESDSRNENMSGSYKDNLSTMINHLRTDVVKHKDFFIILGVDEQHKLVAANPQVLKTHIEYAKADPKAIFTSMYDLEKADKTHLKPSALAEHGNRIYKALKQLEDGYRGALSEKAAQFHKK
jgi:hypothetical protein